MGKTNTSIGSKLSGFLIVISAVGLGLSLWAKGLIGVEKLTIFLVLAVIAAALRSVWVKLILAIAGLGFFLLEMTGYDILVFGSAAVALGALLLALFGLYMILGGFRK